MNQNETANALGLGGFLKEYKTTAAGFAILIIIMLVCLSVAAIFFTIALSGDVSQDLGGKIILFILGLFFLLPVLIGIYGLTRGRNNCLRFYDNGLLVRKSGQEFLTTWDEIDSYTQGFVFTIEKKEVTAFDFGLNGLKDKDEIKAKLRDEIIMRRKLPQVKAAIWQGSSIQFTGLNAAENTFNSATGFKYTSGFTAGANGIGVDDWKNRIARKDITEYGTAPGGSGKLTVEYTFIKDANTGFQTLLETLSDQQLLIALCAEMKDLSGDKTFN